MRQTDKSVVMAIWTIVSAVCGKQRSTGFLFVGGMMTDDGFAQKGVDFLRLTGEH